MHRSFLFLVALALAGGCSQASLFGAALPALPIPPDGIREVATLTLVADGADVTYQFGGTSLGETVLWSTGTLVFQAPEEVGPFRITFEADNGVPALEDGNVVILEAGAVAQLTPRASALVPGDGVSRHAVRVEVCTSMSADGACALWTTVEPSPGGPPPTVTIVNKTDVQRLGGGRAGVDDDG